MRSPGERKQVMFTERVKRNVLTALVSDSCRSMQELQLFGAQNEAQLSRTATRS